MSSSTASRSYELDWKFNIIKFKDQYFVLDLGFIQDIIRMVPKNKGQMNTPWSDQVPLVLTLDFGLELDNLVLHYHLKQENL